MTNDSDALICVLYKEYLQRRKDGNTKIDAKSFGSDYHIHETLIPKWLKEDVTETCWELVRAGLLHTVDADNHAYLVFLTDTGIIYMENRFKNGIVGVLDRISQLRDLLPI